MGKAVVEKMGTGALALLVLLMLTRGCGRWMRGVGAGVPKLFPTLRSQALWEKLLVRTAAPEDFVPYVPTLPRDVLWGSHLTSSLHLPRQGRGCAFAHSR